MKKITFDLYKIIFLLVLMVFACNKEDDLILNETSHRVIFTSEMDFENTIEVDGEISFGDVSQGVESRTWTFPTGVVDILDSDNDNTSSEANVKTIWNTTGVFEVHLNQTFRQDAYVGETQQGRVLDTTIIVTVLDSIQVGIEAQYINPDGTLGDFLSITDNAENEIPAARSVRFTWTGKGEPRFITWDFERADPATFTSMDSVIDVKYKFLGTFDLMVIGSRSRPFGRDTLILENFMKVVPSTDPVVVEEITEVDGNIAVFFQRELEPSTLEESDFSIEVKHDGEVITSTFSSISIDPNEGNVVLIDLGGEEIYNDDSITVSFIEGTLTSLDGVVATGFTDELLLFRKVNILEANSDFDYSFEASTADNWIHSGWGDPWDKFTLSISSSMAYDGNNSAFIEMEPGGNMICHLVDLGGSEIQFPANSQKEYEIGSWIYLVNVGEATGLQSDLRFYWEPNFPNSAPNPEFNADFPLNQWVYSSNFVKFDETTDYSLRIRGFNESNPEPLQFYLDNITLAEVRLRP